MTGRYLATLRRSFSLSQVDAAARLGVSQGLLSQMEAGRRQVSAKLAMKAALAFPVEPTELPLDRSITSAQDLSEELGALEYPGFVYLARGLPRNPAVVLLDALDRQNLEVRVVEGLPWLPFRYPHMDWDWVVREAKLANLQNKVGFVVELGLQMATKHGRNESMERLPPVLKVLEEARLMKETTLCQEAWPPRVRQHTLEGRSPSAAFWNLVTRIQEADLAHYA